MQRLPSAVLGIICIAVSMLIVWSVNPAGAGEQTAAKTEATAGQESAGGAKRALLLMRCTVRLTCMPSMAALFRR